MARELGSCGHRLGRTNAHAVDSDWPYPAGFFDIIVSNQVVEHVQDHDQFFSQVAKCLAPNGFSVHLFPLKHVVEWHLLIPFAHRIMNYDLLKAFIALCSKLRVGICRKQPPSTVLPDFSEGHAAYVVKYTNYITYGDLQSLTKRQGLLVSMRYTKEFYLQKVRQIFSQPARRYSRKRSILGDWLLVFFLRYVQGVTVLLEKGGHYHGGNS
jgi:SAM-dependent methyltransferase